MGSSLVENAGIAASPALGRAQREEYPRVGELPLDLPEVGVRARDDPPDALGRREAEVRGHDAGSAVQGDAFGGDARGGRNLDLVLVPVKDSKVYFWVERDSDNYFHN